MQNLTWPKIGLESLWTCANIPCKSWGINSKNKQEVVYDDHQTNHKIYAASVCYKKQTKYNNLKVKSKKIITKKNRNGGIFGNDRSNI